MLAHSRNTHREVVDDHSVSVYCWQGTIKVCTTSTSGQAIVAALTHLHTIITDGTPRLYQSDPSGTYSEWTANAIGRNHKTVVEYLEKHHTAPDTTTEADAIRLTLRALLEVVDVGGQQIELAVVRHGTGMEFVSSSDVERISKEIGSEIEAEKAKKDKKGEAKTNT